MQRSPGQSQQPAPQQAPRQQATQPGASSHITPGDPLSQPAALPPEVHQEHAPATDSSHAITTQARDARGIDMSPAEACGRLLSDPGRFLKQVPIKIFGLGPSQRSGEADYAMLHRDTSTRGETPMRPSLVFGTNRMRDTVAFDIKPASLVPNDDGHRFKAHAIRVDEGTAAMNFHRLDDTGPSIMLTGELSGCSVVMQPVGEGHVDVAHVKPSPSRKGTKGQDGEPDMPDIPAQTGKELYAELKGAQPAASIYGASATGGQYDSDDRRAEIIGVRAPDGQWRLFAQKKDAADGSIRSVYQIFPNEKKL